MHLCLFLKRKLRFSLLSFTSFSFKSLRYNYSLLRVRNHALLKCHIFTLFSHNRHDHAKIRVLVNIFSVRFSNLKKIFCCLSHFHFQRWIKKLYTLKIKNHTMNNPQPPFPFPIPKLRLLNTLPPSDPPKTLWLNSHFFVPNIRL